MAGPARKQDEANPVCYLNGQKNLGQYSATLSSRLVNDVTLKGTRISFDGRG